VNYPFKFIPRSVPVILGFWYFCEVVIPVAVTCGPDTFVDSETKNTVKHTLKKFWGAGNTSNLKTK